MIVGRPDFSLEYAALIEVTGTRAAGIDEAGRGPLCGPVLAAAVVFPTGVPEDLAAQLDDSKKLSRKRRAAAYFALHEANVAEIGIGAASVPEILKFNILNASLLAMRRAVARLPITPDIALIDGNQAPDLPCPVRRIIGGDGLSLSIAAASIVAKVVRDHCLALLARRYPGYGWEHNAGYPTGAHRAALAAIGVTPHHRIGFAPVARRLAQT